MERVIAYVDGFNLYYGLRSKGWKRYYWLNIQALVSHLLKPGQTLVTTKYFTAVVRRPDDKRRRQATFLEALQTLSNFEFHYGHYLADMVTCRNCGHTYETHHEKMTDVNISVELMTDGFQDRFDTALLISADSDLVGPIKAVRSLFATKRVIVGFPPERASKALMHVAHGHFHIGRDTLARSQFPDTVVKPSGVVLSRPVEWR